MTKDIRKDASIQKTFLKQNKKEKNSNYKNSNNRNNNNKNYFKVPTMIINEEMTPTYLSFIDSWVKDFIKDDAISDHLLSRRALLIGGNLPERHGQQAIIMIYDKSQPSDVITARLFLIKNELHIQTNYDGDFLPYCEFIITTGVFTFFEIDKIQRPRFTGIMKQAWFKNSWENLEAEIITTIISNIVNHDGMIFKRNRLNDIISVTVSNTRLINNAYRDMKHSETVCKYPNSSPNMGRKLPVYRSLLDTIISEKIGVNVPEKNFLSKSLIIDMCTSQITVDGIVKDVSCVVTTDNFSRDFKKMEIQEFKLLFFSQQIPNDPEPMGFMMIRGIFPEKGMAILKYANILRKKYEGQSSFVFPSRTDSKKKKKGNPFSSELLQEFQSFPNIKAK